MTELTELERLEMNVVDAKAYAAYSYGYDDDAFDAYAKARDKLEDYLEEQQGNAANAAYDTLRKSVSGRDYKLERDND